MMRQKKINVHRINVYSIGEGDWCVWIPPALGHWTEVYDMDGETLVGPYGDTYWATWEDAVDFVQSFISKNLTLAST